MKLRIAALLVGASLIAGACSKPTPAPAPAETVDAKKIEADAHNGYVAAINSNNLDTFLAALTDDVVYQPPGAPEIVGKAAIREWAGGFLADKTTKWEKTSLGFTVSGDWAFERYTYKSTDTNKKTGAVTTDTGKGINVFKREADGKWRVAIDGWSSDKPAA